MINKKKTAHIFYKLGIRTSLYTSFLSVLFLHLLLYFFDLDIPTIWGLTAIIFVVVFIISYAVSYRLEYRRIKLLERVSKNISKKQFEEPEYVRKAYEDELDYITMRLVKSSRMVDREIQRLNKTENYRKEFIGDISHELKTPIFAIQGFIETLLNGALEDESVNVKFLQKAMRNVNRLIFLTKDLMEISRLETGELKSEFEEILLFELIQDVIESLHYKAEKEGVDLVIHDFDPNTLVKADKSQLRQVFVNLVENGIKYNVRGGNVQVGINELEGSHNIEFYVKDTGMGIDEPDLHRVTERFFRVDKSRSRERGGTGLGLSIVKHIVEAHGETLSIASEPNIGSTFSITLSKISD